MSGPKIVTLKVEALIDVELVSGEPIVCGIKFISGRSSIYIPEPDVSGQMDELILEAFADAILREFRLQPVAVGKVTGEGEVEGI